MAGFWAIIVHRYRSYLYLVPALASIPAATWVIKTQAPLDQQLWWAAGYMMVLMMAVVLTVPYNYFIGARKRFFKCIDGFGMEEIDIPFSTTNPPYIRNMPPIEVNGVLIPRTELVIPTDRPVDVSEILPSVGKARVFGIRFHGLPSQRIEFQNGVVYFRGTPLDSTNTESALGYFVEPDVTLTPAEFGPSAVFEVVFFVHGDRKRYTTPDFMDLFWAQWFKTHPEEAVEEKVYA
jgi:hypothetical protein